jgi:lipopolysaccharide export system protein LptA
MAKSRRTSRSVSASAGAIIALAAAWTCAPSFGQGFQGEGIKFPIYYQAHELTKGQSNRLKLLITSKTAELLPNSIYRLGGMYLQHQDGFGRTNLIARSPECFYNHERKTVSSAASLSVNADNGLLYLEGVGFFGNFTNMTLNLSNKVETRIREDIATQVRTNKSRAGMLTGNLAKGKTNAIATGTNALPNTNYVTIISDRMFFAHSSNTVTYFDNVRVNATQFELACEELHGKRSTNGTLESIVAEQNVVLFNKSDGSSATGDHAMYEMGQGQETVLLSGNRARWQDQLREAMAKRFWFDLKEQRFRAEEGTFIKLPRVSLEGQSLFSQQPAPTNAPARTNAPRTTNVVSGDLEIMAELLEVQLATTNHPGRTVRAATNVVIVSTADKSRATANEARFAETTGILELIGNAFWQTGERVVSGELLFLDRTNRIFAVNSNAYIRLPMSELGKQALLSPFTLSQTNRASGSTNAVAATNAPQFLELWCDNFDYRGNLLTFRENVRARFFEGTNAVGALSCGLLSLRFNSNQVESVTAKHKVHLDQFPYPTTNGVVVFKSLDCGGLTALLTTNGWIKQVIAENDVAGVQVERSGTNAPVTSSLRGQMVILNFFTHTNQLHELVAVRDVQLAHENRKGFGQRAVYDVTKGTVELTGNPTAEFPDIAGKITEAEALLYDVAEKKFTVLKPRGQLQRAPTGATNQSNLPLLR